MTHLEQFFEKKQKALKLPGTPFWIDIRQNKDDEEKVDLVILNPFSSQEHQGLLGLSVEMAGKMLDKLFV